MIVRKVNLYNTFDLIKILARGHVSRSQIRLTTHVVGDWFFRSFFIDLAADYLIKKVAVFNADYIVLHWQRMSLTRGTSVRCIVLSLSSLVLKGMVFLYTVHLLFGWQRTSLTTSNPDRCRCLLSHFDFIGVPSCIPDIFF